MPLEYGCRDGFQRFVGDRFAGRLFVQTSEGVVGNGVGDALQQRAVLVIRIRWDGITPWVLLLLAEQRWYITHVHHENVRQGCSCSRRRFVVVNVHRWWL